MPADRGRPNKFALNMLGRDFNSMTSQSSYTEITRTMALSHDRTSRYDDQHDIVEALLPSMGERHSSRVKREFTVDTSSIACSLDFLAAIANMQPRFTVESEYNKSSDDDTEVKTNDIDDTYNDDDGDGMADGEYERDMDMEDELDDVTSSGDNLDEPRLSPEENAAATLLMARVLHSCPMPRTTRRVTANECEGGTLRSRRLSQNQLYRKRLHDKGVYPIRRGPKHYVCSLCREVFDKEMFVWRHGVKHLETKPFQCSLCGGRFNRSDSLQRHMRNFHKKV